MGWDPIGDIRKEIDSVSEGNPLSAILDWSVQYMTQGIIGRDKKTGDIKKGYATQTLDEGIGEVSGRNAARKQIMEAKDNLAQEKLDRAQLLREEQDRKKRQDISASSQAGLLRDQAAVKQRKLLGSADPSRDFLGL